MNILFVLNYERTMVFRRIADRIEAAGHDVYWCSPSHHWTRWLLAEGTPANRILDLTEAGASWRGIDATREDREELNFLEESAGLRINDIVLMDRLLRTKPYLQVLRYFAVIHRMIRAFLERNQIRYLFGEQTFGIELIAGMVARSFGVGVRVPHPVRIPSGRLGFFRDHLHADLEQLRPVTDEDRRWAREFLAQFHKERPHPRHFYLSNKVPIPRFEWVGKFARHVRRDLDDRYDETHFPARWLMRKRLCEVYNAWMSRALDPFERPCLPPERPFVLFTLHRQPEASVDVLGSSFSNQLELVKSLSRTLPVTHDLYVKEHSNGIGDRSSSEHAAFRRVPGVRLIHPAIDSFSLIEASDLVISISGTVAYEAALMGKRAVSVSRMFFGPLLQANGFNPYEDSVADLLRQDGPSASDEERVEFLARVQASSFSGSVANPNLNAGILDSANIDGVSLGFLALLDGPLGLKALAT